MLKESSTKEKTEDLIQKKLDDLKDNHNTQLWSCQIISWQCKKQTVVATSTTEAEYVAAANCCGQLIVYSIKLYWSSTAPVFYNEALASPKQTAIAMASPKQTAIGKDLSNPFMAGSLPKTTLCVILSAEASNEENGEVKINAIIDGHSLSITDGSLRRHLKLADQDGISSIPTTEIFEQFALMGYHTDLDKLTFQKGAFSPQWRITSSPSTLNPTHPLLLNPPYQPSTTQPIINTPGPEPTNLLHPMTRLLHVVHLHGSDKGSLKLQELMNLVTTLSDRIGVLEVDLMKTKQTYSSAYTKLILRIKKLESQLKIGKARTQARVVLSDDEAFEDDSSKQGRKLFDEEKASDEVSTAGAKKGTASEKVPIVSNDERRTWSETLRVSYKRKSPSEKVVEEEIGTQEELKQDVKEPAAKRKKSIPRKTTRKRQKLEEDAEKDELKGFLDIVPREEVPIEYSEEMEVQRIILSEMLEDFDRLDVEELFRLVKERYSTSRPEGFDLMLWGDLHTLFEPSEDDEIWRDQHEYNLLSGVIITEVSFKPRDVNKDVKQKIGDWNNEERYELGYVETEFPAIVFSDTLTFEAALSCEPTVSSLNNDEIDFRISFDESDDEDCTPLVLLEISEIAKLAIYLEWGDSGEGEGCLSMGFCLVLQGKEWVNTREGFGGKNGREKWFGFNRKGFGVMAKLVPHPYNDYCNYGPCGDIRIVVIMEYLVKDSKRREFWSLNEDILKITILKTNTPYPSRKIWCIRACTHQRPHRIKLNTPYPERLNTPENQEYG
ncbi:hypothetical protein Tco_1214846 [Tanacetum coccineum]